jgi:heparosan-N-sulfate-glucuronate 5-epimerase
MAHDHIGLWIYDFRDTRAYNIRPPMYSAMVQGYGISVLLRAYDLTKKEAFIDAAERALCAYDFDVRHMGVRSVFRGYTFYEEAPSTPPSCILNGFVFALVGLYDFVRFNGNIKAKLRFDEGINTLVNCLTLYDTGYWSRYNLMYHNFIASRYYHDIHVLQLKLLYMITRQQVFGDYAGKWECYQKDLWCRTRSHACYYFYRFSYKLARIKALLSSI